MDKSNSDIASFMRRTADLLELHGENPFKVRSYRTASGTIEDLERSLADLARETGAAGLLELSGIGKGIAGQIVEFVETGTSAAYERLRDVVPESAVEILLVRGIGMKMGTILYKDFGIRDLDDLQRFAEGGGFEAIPGLGDKSIVRFVSAIADTVDAQDRVALADAERWAGDLVAELGAAHPDVEIVVAGEVRRRRSEVSGIDLLAVTAGDPSGVIASFLTLPSVEEPLVHAPSRAEATTRDGLRAVLYVAAPEAAGIALLRATGSPRHVRQLEERAQERGVSLGGADLDTEEEVYARLGLPFVPPERREGLDEVTG